MSKIEINISDQRTPAWFRRIVAFTFAVVAPIGIGITVESPAMEWAGFACAVLFITALLVGKKTGETVYSFEAAHRRLDELEGKAATP